MTNLKGVFQKVKKWDGRFRHASCKAWDAPTKPGILKFIVEVQMPQEKRAVA